MSTEEILAAIDAEIGKLQQVRALLAGYSDPTLALKRQARQGTKSARAASGKSGDA